MTPRYTRRQAIGILAGGAAALPLLTRQLGAARAGDAVTTAESVWVPALSGPVVVGRSNVVRERVLFQPTLLPVGHFIPGHPYAADGHVWYLWAWHHQGDHPHLFTAASPQGPYTARGPLLPPPSWPLAGYNPSLLTAGDIVWDAANSRLIAAPHSWVAGHPVFNAHLMSSTDGVNWDWLDGDPSPRLLAGSGDAVNHVGFSRLLRDVDGNLATYNGKYWWVFRAATFGTPNKYYPNLASTPSLSTYPWTIEAGRPFTTPTSPVGNFYLGSFIQDDDGNRHIYAAPSVSDLPPNHETVYTAGPGSMSFGPGVPLAYQPVHDDGAVSPAGAYLIRNPANAQRYLVMTFLYASPERSETWVYKEQMHP